MIARLFSLLCPIVLRRYVFSLRSPLKERSAQHDVAGITARIDTTFFESLARTAASASDQQNSSRASNVSRSTAKTYSKTTTFISQVVFFYFQVFCFLFLLNFIFQFHRLSFLYCPNFWRFARIFSRLGGLPPPPPRPPGSYAYAYGSQYQKLLKDLGRHHKRISYCQ